MFHSHRSLSWPVCCVQVILDVACAVVNSIDGRSHPKSLKSVPDSTSSVNGGIGCIELMEVSDVHAEAKAVVAKIVSLITKGDSSGVIQPAHTHNAFT